MQSDAFCVERTECAKDNHVNGQSISVKGLMLKTGIVRSVAYATGVSCGESDDIGFFQFLSYDIML